MTATKPHMFQSGKEFRVSVGPTSHWFTSQRLRLHYLDWGNPQAPLLILLHGGRDHARSWDWVAEKLCADWHVIAPDLRGHGDSNWTNDGNYDTQDMVYDLAQLLQQLGQLPVTLIGHSLGGNICTRYTGLYPDRVRKLVSIEGLGPSPAYQAKLEETPWPERVREWIEKKRDASSRSPRKYASLDDAVARMCEANGFLSQEQAHHLTLHGLLRNEDGSWSWKFDPYLNVWQPFTHVPGQTEELWNAINCPTLLLYGADSWASNPKNDGRLDHFRHARVILFEKAGHWLHHDQYDRFMQEITVFL